MPPATHRTGWRSRGDWDICSLGWEVLDWTHASLPDPRDGSRPLVLTPEQARRVLRIYELDPFTGRRLYSRIHQEEAKGWGKGPLAAVLALAEFGGAPVVFCCWGTCGSKGAVPGQPHGKPWGGPGLPAPYVQVVAVSEAQTFNVWSQVMTLAANARGQLADVVTVDSGRPGRTMLRRRDIPAAELARVTASAISREGALVVHSILDEVQLWTPSNAGDELARVVLRNLDKSGGWAHFLNNAPVLGHESVAEMWGEPAPGALHFATRPSEIPEPDWPEEQLRDALEQVYHDVPWIDIDRQLQSLALSQVPWHDTLRFKFNVRTETGNESLWMPADVWEDRAGDVAFDAVHPGYVCVRIGHDHRVAAVAIAQRQGEDVVLAVRTFEGGGEYVDAGAIEQHIIDLRPTLPARVLADVHKRGGSTRQVPKAGPLVLHHGAFFESSRQRLEALGIASLDVPSSPERLTPAAEMLMQLTTTGHLRHDGDPELAAQMARVIATEKPKGWAIESATSEPIVAVHAAMLAVHWAVAYPVPPAKAPTFRSF